MASPKAFCSPPCFKIKILLYFLLKIIFLTHLEYVPKIPRNIINVWKIQKMLNFNNLVSDLVNSLSGEVFSSFDMKLLNV